MIGAEAQAAASPQPLTPEQRLAMVTVLTRRMWELTGLPVPSYERAAMPGRVRRPA